MTDGLDRDLELRDKGLIRKYGSRVHSSAFTVLDLVVNFGMDMKKVGQHERAAKFVSCVAALMKKADAELGWEAWKKEQEEGD